MTWSAKQLVAGHAALDFANTFGDRGKSRKEDLISDLPAFRAWSNVSGLAEWYSDWREPHGRQSEAAVLNSLHCLRRHLYEFLLGVSERQAKHCDYHVSVTIQDFIREAMCRGRLAPKEKHCIGWLANPDSEWCYLDAVSLAVESLLRSPDLFRVRQCRRCTWFFINKGRGRGRQWCDMRTCGNRAKVERFRRG